MNSADVWQTLTADERAMVLRICMPSMRKVPKLLTLRYLSRKAQLANRTGYAPLWRYAGGEWNDVDGQ